MTQFRSASLLESTSFAALVTVPLMARGMFRSRRRAIRAMTATDTDGKAISLMTSMSRRYDGQPVWVRSGLDESLVLLAPEDIPRVMLASIEEFTADTPNARKGMVHYQPDGIASARGAHWRSRRDFHDAMFEHAPRQFSRVAEVARAETEAIFADRATVDWNLWHKCFQRIARRVILGDNAAGDWMVTETLEKMTASANLLPGKRSPDLSTFQNRVAAYLRRRQAGSLAELISDVPIDPLTKPAGQMAQWLNHLGDQLAAATFRSAALLVTHPEIADRATSDPTGSWYEAVLSESLRLWPTTPVISRVAVKDVTWGPDNVLPKGARVLIVNHYFQRDPERLPYANHFAPHEWITGTAATHPAMNFFGSGTQDCPARRLSMTVGHAVLASLPAGTELVSPGNFAPRPDVAEHCVPTMFDHFGIRLRRPRKLAGSGTTVS